jgi:hypothetical protein
MYVAMGHLGNHGVLDSALEPRKIVALWDSLGAQGTTLMQLVSTFIPSKHYLS